jgi:hypothetical protein
MNAVKLTLTDVLKTVKCHENNGICKVVYCTQLPMLVYKNRVADQSVVRLPATTPLLLQRLIAALQGAARAAATRHILTSWPLRGWRIVLASDGYLLVFFRIKDQLRSCETCVAGTAANNPIYTAHIYRMCSYTCYWLFLEWEGTICGCRIQTVVPRQESS